MQAFLQLRKSQPFDARTGFIDLSGLLQCNDCVLHFALVPLTSREGGLNIFSSFLLCSYLFNCGEGTQRLAHEHK